MYPENCTKTLKADPQPTGINYLKKFTSPGEDSEESYLKLD